MVIDFFMAHRIRRSEGEHRALIRRLGDHGVVKRMRSLTAEEPSVTVIPAVEAYRLRSNQQFGEACTCLRS